MNALRTIKVRMRFAGYLRSLIGDEIEIECREGATIRELIKEITKSRDLGFTISDNDFIFAINGKEVRSDKELTRDCIIDVYPIFHGGFNLSNFLI